ncbi:MAG: hypothetical protein WCG85_16645 [Polyangia bacterium]
MENQIGNMWPGHGEPTPSKDTYLSDAFETWFAINHPIMAIYSCHQRSNYTYKKNIARAAWNAAVAEANAKLDCSSYDSHKSNP